MLFSCFLWSFIIHALQVIQLFSKWWIFMVPNFILYNPCCNSNLCIFLLTYLYLYFRELVRLLDQYVYIFIWENNLPPKNVIAILILTNSRWERASPHTVPSFGHLHFRLCQSIEWRWYFICPICMSLVSSEVVHLFICLFAVLHPLAWLAFAFLSNGLTPISYHFVEF